jgi:hypothetical protein
MTRRNRETLKNYFREGQLPTEDHFADLIDSMLNMSDEGFRKTVERGEEIYAPLGHDALLSFLRDQNPDSVLWRVALSRARNQLLLQRGDSAGDAASAPLLCLDADQGGGQRVGIGTAAPQDMLDVQGTVRSSGRRGSYQRNAPEPLRANGQWQNLTDDLQGCQGFELMAGVGQKGSGRFALLQAVALNTYNPTWGWLDFFNRKRGIRSTQAFWGRRCDRLQLRWHGGDDQGDKNAKSVKSGRDASYRLQIRTGCDFGDKCLINAQLTQLWFDPHMEECQR